MAQRSSFAALLEGAWRLLSGFEHGLGWAMLRGANRGAATEVPGGVGMVLSIKDEEFVLAAKTTYALLVNACRLFKTRHFGAVTAVNNGSQLSVSTKPDSPPNSRIQYANPASNPPPGTVGCSITQQPPAPPCTKSNTRGTTAAGSVHWIPKPKP